MLIEFKNVSKDFKILDPNKKFPMNHFSPKISKKAVKNLNFRIEQGEIVGYIGLNGAGKSTTIKLMSGVIAPTEGSISVDGKNPFKERASNARNMGVLFGQRTQLVWDLPVIHSFKLLFAIYGINQELDKEYLNKLYDTLDVRELLNIPVRFLSLGQRMKCEFCSILLHRPKYIFLDEATTGMDVILKKKFVDLLKKINEEFNTTIIFTSHNLDEVEQLCNRVVLIHNGELIFSGSMSKLKKIYSDHINILISMEDGEEITEELKDYKPIFKSGKYIMQCSSSKSELLKCISKLTSIKEVKSFEVIEENLEDIVTKIYG